MIAELAATISILAARQDVHVVAIEARGKVFCGGRDGKGDSSEGLTPYQIRTQMMGPVLSVYEALATAPVPVIACVHGDAIGFGAALVGGCDVALASSEAHFAFPEISHSIAPTMAMSAVIRKIPPAKLAYLIYTGERLTAAEAMQCGLVGKVYEAAGFDRSCRDMIAGLATKPRAILETIKKYQVGAAALPAALASDYAGALLTIVRQESKDSAVQPPRGV